MDGLFTLDVILFTLRLISAVILLAILAAIFVAIWRDHKATLERLEASRRTYGQLVGLVEVEDQYVLNGLTFPLLPLTTLGRSPANSITINDTFASGEHARVFLRDGQWWLEDRRSRNGTMLNNSLIHEAVIMTHGDIISIGETRFRLELE